MSTMQDGKMVVPRRVAQARRSSRAKDAKSFINKTVPAILKSNARARRGVEAATLITDPRKYETSRRQDIPPGQTKEKDAEPEVAIPVPPRMTLRVTDTLEAASQLAGPSSRVAILNMASPLRPGGGVLSGATSQEEQLCRRTTLYPSLREEFYRLPDVGGVYTPDVLVVRSWDTAVDKELPVSRRFLVDVITAAMLRMPDVEGSMYAEDKDKEMVVRKMRAVMRMARAMEVDRIVLGAWGCGAYGNPVGEIAKAWKRVLCGGRARKNKDKNDMEGWDGLEVVFAIKDRRMAETFRHEFGDELMVEGEDGGDEPEVCNSQDEASEASDEL